MSAGPFTIILVGPQGSGRRDIADLMVRQRDTYGVSQVVEDWEPGHALVLGAVHIALEAPRVLPAGVQLFRTLGDGGRFWWAASGDQR